MSEVSKNFTLISYNIIVVISKKKKKHLTQKSFLFLRDLDTSIYSSSRHFNYCDIMRTEVINVVFDFEAQGTSHAPMLVPLHCMLS